MYSQQSDANRVASAANTLRDRPRWIRWSRTRGACSDVCGVEATRPRSPRSPSLSSRRRRRRRAAAAGAPRHGSRRMRWRLRASRSPSLSSRCRRRAAAAGGGASRHGGRVRWRCRSSRLPSLSSRRLRHCCCCRGRSIVLLCEPPLPSLVSLLCVLKSPHRLHRLGALNRTARVSDRDHVALSQTFGLTLLRLGTSRRVPAHLCLLPLRCGKYDAKFFRELSTGAALTGGGKALLFGHVGREAVVGTLKLLSLEPARVFVALALLAE